MATTAYREINRCRICGNYTLEHVLSLGTQHLTGVFSKTPTQKVSAGPLELVKCREDEDGNNCGLLQLKHSFNPDEMYRADYGYRSGINQSMTNHLQHVVRSVLGHVELKSGDVVLDIGSNDATLLKAYPHANISCIGIDPSGESFHRFYPSQITLVVDYFSADAVKPFLDGKKAKIITSIAMFYDLASPLAFMQDIKGVLAEDGVWVSEQSYMPAMLRQNTYDTVCHEHLEYYGLRQIKWMADRVGFRILDVELNDINGGSFRVTMACERSNYQPVSNQWLALLEQEKELGLDTLRPYREFKDSVYRHRDDLIRTIRDINKRGETILGYGASTKGNVLLQFCGFTGRDIPAIADRNPEKHGRYTPGTLIPIISEERARARKPDYFLALPWHFKEEFLKRERAFLESGGKIMFPLPKIEAVGK